MSARPTQIRIGPYVFDILWSNRNLIGTSLDTFGTCSCDMQRIEIAGGNKNQKLAVTLIHEIVHACRTIYGLCRDNEEHDVEVFSNAMASVLLANPGLLDFLRDCSDNPDGQVAP